VRALREPAVVGAVRAGLERRLAGQRARVASRVAKPGAGAHLTYYVGWLWRAVAAGGKPQPDRKGTDMIGDLFDSPWKVLIVAVVLIVLFGSKKLPHAARSLGQSMRILKKEVSDLHHDEPDTEAQATPRATAGPPAQLPEGPSRPADPGRRSPAAGR